MSSEKFRLHSYFGHHVRELQVYFQGLQLPRRDLSVVFCVDGPNDGMSSGLRGYALAEALNNLSWRATVIPHQLELKQRNRIIKLEKPQILVLQSPRHPLNRPHLYPNQFCVLDLDDADFLDPICKNTVIDCAKGSQAAIAGSRYVASFLKQYCKKVKVVWTGSQPLDKREEFVKDNPPIIAWACSSPFSYLEEAKLVQKIILSLSKNIHCQFWLIGVQDLNQGSNFIQPIVDYGIPCKLIPFLPYSKLLDVLKKVSIGLAPLLPEESIFSSGKSFGKILAYLNTNAVVIASNCVDHPLFFKDGVNGFLASTVTEWIQAIEFLINTPEVRFSIAEKAKNDYLERLSVQASAAITDSTLRSFLDSSSRQT
jgi:hypothetical protein